MTWGELLQVLTTQLQQANVEEAHLVARHYMQDVFGKVDKTAIAQPTSIDIERTIADAVRLSKGEPLAYVTGIAHFYGHEFFVNQHVLSPRPETEELVRWVLENHADEHLYLVDLCTGSGCIAASLSHERPSWNVLAVDLDPRVIEVAEANFISVEVADKTRGEVHDVLLEED